MSGDGHSSDHLLQALAALPLFPLPGTVFFPHTLLPLHVFEPRYRQMTEHVIAGHGHMAVVLIDAANTDRTPKRCAPVAGLGRLVHHERLPDGRFHILLQGIARVSLDEELPADGLLYRRLRAHVIDDDVATDGSDVDGDLQRLRACYARVVNEKPEAKDTLGDLPLRLASPAVIADLVCAALLDDVALRQRALEETRVAGRLQFANDAMATLLLRHLPDDNRQVH